MWRRGPIFFTFTLKFFCRCQCGTKVTMPTHCSSKVCHLNLRDGSATIISSTDISESFWRMFFYMRKWTPRGDGYLAGISPEEAPKTISKRCSSIVSQDGRRRVMSTCFSSSFRIQCSAAGCCPLRTCMATKCTSLVVPKGIGFRYPHFRCIV